MGKIVGNVFLNLFIGGFFDIPSEVISIWSYKIIFWATIILYIFGCVLLIKKMLKGGRKHIVDEWNEDAFVLRKGVKVSLIVIIIFSISLLMYLIGSGIIQNIAANLSNWLATHFHVVGGETPILEIN